MKTKAEVVFDHTGRVSPGVQQKLKHVIEETAKDVAKSAKESMAEPKHGRVYIIGGKRHQASAPGEAPAILSGDLIESIEPYEKKELLWIVPAKHEQALWEFGIRGFGARPYFRPAAEEQGPKFLDDCANAVRGGAEGG